MICIDMTVLGTHGCPVQARIHSDGTVDFVGNCPTCMEHGQQEPMWGTVAEVLLRSLAIVHQDIDDYERQIDTWEQLEAYEEVEER